MPSLMSKFGNRHLVLAAAIAAVGPALVLARLPHDQRQPATTQAAGTIDERIRYALSQQGTVDALAAELNGSGLTDPATLAAITRVALEQGEPARASETLRGQLSATPNDVTLLRQAAAVDDMLGRTEAAQDALRAALTLTTDRAARVDIRLRLALLAFDNGQAAEGTRLLDAVAQDDPAASRRAGIIACLAGEYDAAVRLLGRAPGDGRAAIKLLQGNAALRGNHTADAKAAFDAALRMATDAQDRQYAQERVVAAARQANALPALADAWLADPHLPPQQLLPLAGVLRELGRVPDLLARWRQAAADPTLQAAALSPRFIGEVIGASQEAGLDDQAEAVARDVLSLKPGDERTLSVVVQMLLNHGKPADADALLAGRVAACSEQPDELERLARLARSMGRDDVAIAAARSMRKLGGDNAVSGLLFEATVRLRAGDKSEGVARLHEAATAAAGRPAALREVATAYENAGQDDEAVTLLQACVRQSSDDVTLERLAALLVQQRRFADATVVLQRLRTGGSSPAVRGQAGQRLMDIAVAQKQVGPLIADLRSAFDAGKSTEADLSLLIDAYLRSNQIAEAADVLQRNTLLDRKATLSRLAVLYIRTGNPDQASPVLRELVTVDPDHAVATLERLASVELDRKQPKAASAVVSEIASRIGRDSASFSELMGGIYDRLNRPAEAALFYRRVLVAKPENADGWLLWATATAKAKKPRQAIGRLLLLCGEAKSEAVFSAAVDGLLNLKAPPAALRAARREAMLRAAAAATHKSMLFQVIADLSDELQDGTAVVRAIDVNVVMDREERPQLLRELMENASGKGLLDEANACGRSMLALNDDFPPQLFIQLGEQLLIAGRVQDASRAFSRASEVGSDEQVAPRVADLLEQYGSPTIALRVLAPLAERKRTVLSLRQSLARLNELSGKTAAAFDAYLSTLPLADRELAALAQTRPTPGAIPSPRPDLTALVNGAIATARTPAQKQLLFDALLVRVRREFDAIPADASISPSFAQWAGELRRAGFIMGLTDAVTRLDDELIARRPDLKPLGNAALSARIDHGMFEAASHFARVHGLQSRLPASLRLELPEAATRATQPPTDLDDAVLRLPRLLARGENESARKLLRELPLVLPAKPADSVPTLIAAAVACGDQDGATQWATLWVRYAVAQPSASTAPTRPASAPTSSAVSSLRSLVQSTWRILPVAARAEIVRQALALSDRTNGTADATNAATIALQLAAAERLDLPNGLEIALRFSPSAKPTKDQDRGTLTELATRFALLPPRDRPAFVPRAIERLPQDSGLAFLGRVVAASTEPFDAKTDAALIAAADELPDGQAVVWSSWFTSTVHRPVMAALGRATLRAVAPGTAGPGDLASTVAAAVALSADAPADASRTAVDAILGLLSDAAAVAADDSPRDRVPATRPAATTPAMRALPAGVGRLTLTRYAAVVIDAEARARLLDSLAATHRTAPGTSTRQAWSLAIRSVLLDAAGRRGESLDALRQAFAADRDDREIRQAWIDRLTQDGRSAELVDSFPLTSTPLPIQVREPLAAARRSLFRGREVPLETKSVGVSAVTPRRVLDFMTPRATDDHAELAETLRQFLERLRTNADGLSPVIEADPGGQSIPPHAPAPLFFDIASWPGAVDDLYATLRTVPPGRLAADRLTDVLADAAADSSVATKLLDLLAVARRSGGVTTNDRILIEKLARRPAVRLPADLLDEIWNDLLLDPTGGPDLRQTAECLRAQNDPRAAGLAAWAAVRSQLGDNGHSTISARNQPLSLPTPLSGFSEQALADRIESLLDQNQADTAEEELATLRATGRILSDQQHRLGLLWARVAAERGDGVAFRARVDQVLGAIAWANLDQPARFDVCSALPKRVTGATIPNATDVLEKAIRHAAGRWPSNPNWTRSIASLGRWCLEHGNAAGAERLIDLAADLGAAAGVGEHQLWVADLAMAIGRSDRAWSIQRLLLDERCLPVMRTPALLLHLDRNGEHEAAARLAKNASRYSKEPNVRQRAF